MKEVRRYLMIGAHPDDADIRFGGTALKLVRAGHVVKFVSMCNGDCGHFDMSIPPEELAARRYRETQNSRAVSGIAEYQVFHENHDCELMPDLENRKKVIRLIREFQPDVVLTHRLCDYHADHRGASQLVLDAAYLTQVPKFCPDVPIPPKNPVYGYTWDDFADPRPFRPDALIPIDDVLEDKCRMMDCHPSQFYEWLAWEKKISLDYTKTPWEERMKILLISLERFVRAADRGRERLVRFYGETGKTTKYAEAFEYCPYGRKISADEFQAIMQG